MLELNQEDYMKNETTAKLNKDTLIAVFKKEYDRMVAEERERRECES